MQNKHVLIIDSGVGGLSIARAIANRLPTLDFHYIADDLRFPYGEMSSDQLIERVGTLVDAACKAKNFDAVVVACNTASTSVLPHLRQSLKIPVIGTIPAVKPAVMTTQSQMVSVVATRHTIASSYLRRLIDNYASTIAVTLIASPDLAQLAERRFLGEGCDLKSIASEILPAFVKNSGKRTDTIVLGCTHYPLIIDDLRSLAPWPVKWLDPANAIANQLARVLYPSCLNWGQKPLPRKTSFEFTSGKNLHELQMRMGELLGETVLPSPGNHLTTGAYTSH